MVGPGRGGPVRFALSTLPVAALLLGVIAYGNGELVHAQLLKLGQLGWDEYHHLRVDPQKPTCSLTLQPAATATTAGADDIDDLLDDDEGDEIDDLLDDDEGAASATRAPDAEAEADDIDDLLGDDEEDNEAASAAAREAALALCREKHATYEKTMGRLTGGVRAFRGLERSIAGFVNFSVNHLRHILALIFLLCALTTTALKAHIALRPPSTRLDHRVSDTAQLAANMLLLLSVWSLMRVDQTSGVTVDHFELHYLWIGGFVALVMVNLKNLARLPDDAEPGGSLVRALMTIPLYTHMALIAGSYFLLAEGHAAGLAIYLSKLTEHAILYLHVGLYVWVGMLLKQTRIASMCFDVLRPWKLPPEMLAFVAVVAAALPTAYSGASGIFVIAVGAVIYKELRRAGSRRQLALAATAMSGSMGVVLSPCLLVVIVASLNKQVTTDQLYGWGTKVFLLSAVLFLVASMLNRQGPMKVAPSSEAMGPSIAMLKKLIPYGLLFAGILLFDFLVLGAHLDEHSAPVMLPVILLAVVTYDSWAARRTGGRETHVGLRTSVSHATEETTGHIGALLMLMGLSICLGGIVERADLMAMVPESFGSVTTTMMVLVVVLVIVGMTLDPYGAVILVSATIADVAYRNGIDPVHFWMVVLVAFELGYLTPPVALNHLLTRQVVEEDDDPDDDAHAEGSFWVRHERILLPISVMGTALILVAFGPLLF